MKRKTKKSLSAVLAFVIVLVMTLSAIPVFSAAESLTYSFAKNQAGYAEGSISLTASSGTYKLFWADNNSALENYSQIASLTFSSTSTKTIQMPAYTAIPAEAKKVIAVKSGETEHTIYFINNVGWSTVYCHAYVKNNTSVRNAAWPGIKMDYVGKNSDGYGVYSISLNSVYDEMQFDNGSSGNKNQTVDITIGTKNAYIISDPSSGGKYNSTNFTYGTENNSTSNENTVAEASAVFDIPKSRLMSNQKLYSFASYSDIQIDNENRAYPYSVSNFAKALEIANDNNTDFIITSGDNVNSQYLSHQKLEWNTYLKTLANSNYCNPVYEAIGNHELWPFDDSGYRDRSSIRLFQTQSGLDSNLTTVNSEKSYYEVTMNGDHFIFMALEGSFHPSDSLSACSIEEFSDEQLNWLKGLLRKYSGDGHNIFVIEHSLFNSYGAGDRITIPYYSGSLNDSRKSTQALKAIFQQYKDIIFISGHTHIELAQQYNYSDNNGTSCQMIHNSSIGGSRNIVNKGLDYIYSQNETEGYIVDVYADRMIFKGTNINSGVFIPNCTYMVKTSASVLGIEPVIETQPLIGDVDNSGTITVEDTTAIQKYIVGIIDESEINLEIADCDIDGHISIKDATAVQMYVVGFYSELPPVKDENVSCSGLLSMVKAELDSSYKYASYNQYMEMKKQYTKLKGANVCTESEYNKLEKAYMEYLALTGSYVLTTTAPITTALIVTNPTTTPITEPSSAITVYFENTPNWSTVYAYTWKGSDHNASWPGIAMSYCGKSKSGNSVYKYTFDFETYHKIIFSNGSTQTVDIPLDGTNNVAFRLSSMNNGKYEVTVTDISNIM